MKNIDDLTIGQARELAKMFEGQCAPQSIASCSCQGNVWEIGKIYLIRTVTMIDTGRLVAVTDKELVLEDAAWIGDTGRFATALTSAEFSEVEPFPDGRVIIGRGSIIDAVQIKCAPRKQK
jgi:hypothetical protein